jgi:hypothetical protein
MGFFDRWRAGERPFPSVAFDDESVTVARSYAKRESVQWRDLQEVRIVTTSAGPFAEDVFFVLVGRKSGCVVPHSKVDPLLPRLQALPGFDNAALIRAMGSADEAVFTVWRAPEA